MKLLLKFILPIAVLLLGFGARNLLIATGPETAKQELEQMIPLVEVMLATAENTTLDLVAYGEVRPRATTHLVAEVAARVLEVSDQLYRGAFFLQGDVLLRLDDTDLKNTVAVAEAQWRQAAAALTLEQAEAEVSIAQWQRLGEGEAPAMVAHEAQLEAARASVDAARANLEIRRTNLARTVLIAPFSGRVLERNVEVGNWVAPGSPLASIYATDFAEVRLPLAASQLDKLGLALDGPSNKIVVELEAKLGNKVGHWQGELVRTEAAMNPATRMIEAIVLLQNPFHATEKSPALAPGMFLNATVRGRKVEGVFRIPRVAILKGNHLRVVDRDQKAHEISVQIVHNTITHSVVSAGLEEGDRIILTPLILFVENMDVQVAPTLEAQQ